MILTADSSNGAKEIGENVELIGYGYSVNLTLAYDLLDVKIDLNNCNGRSLEKNREASPLCNENNFCGFEINGISDTEIDLTGGKEAFKNNVDKTCDLIRMEKVQTSYCGIYAASCKPLIDDKMITIIVEEVSSTCRIFIKNAKIYYPPTTTSTSTTSLPSKESATQTETSEASIEWYIWVIIGVAFVLLIGIIIAIFVCWKKQIGLFKEKTEAKKKITIMDTVDSQIDSKAEDAQNPKNDELEAKPDPKPKSKTPAEEIPRPPKAAKKKSKKSKKGKKQKKHAKKDPVDDPVPPETPVVDAADLVTPSKEPDSVAPPPPQMNSVGHPLSGLTKQQVLDEDYYTPGKIQWIKSRSSKSGESKRKSIGPPIVIPMITVEMKLEPHYSSLQRWKRSALEESKWKEFKQ
uniref:Uncharacterized protein n=1 Tax=Panagrolaimus davidi TaxID=227884 RepID=A0A914QTK2_9BILA